MSDRWNNSGGQDAYTPEQVESVLNELGIEVAGETTNDYLCYCPFHGNRFTPSFSVSRGSGTYICFNASCAETGNFLELVQKVGKLDHFPARRMILRAAAANPKSFTDRLTETLEKTPNFSLWTPGKNKVDGREVIARMVKEFWETPDAIQYMKGRDFEEDTLRHFEIGYSSVKDLLAVPMHDPKGEFPVGVVGRSLKDKKFKNSQKLPTSKTLWNFHRAKRHGETVILTEASFDAMRVHQAGYPNVVACLGGNFSAYHFDQLDRTFNTIIIMTDFDKLQFYKGCKKCEKRSLSVCGGHNPGRDLGSLVASGLNRKRVLWASYGHQQVYPEGAKDAGDMSDDQIRICIKNAVTNLEYSSWGLY